MGGRKITSFIQSLYPGEESAVKLESGCTEWPKVKKSVRQLCILSLSLFIYPEEIITGVTVDKRSGNHDGIKINGYELYDLRYADDTSLLSDTTPGIDTLVQSVK